MYGWFGFICKNPAVGEGDRDYSTAFSDWGLSASNHLRLFLPSSPTVSSKLPWKGDLKSLPFSDDLELSGEFYEGLNFFFLRDPQWLCAYIHSVPLYPKKFIYFRELNFYSALSSLCESEFELSKSFLGYLLSPLCLHPSPETMIFKCSGSLRKDGETAQSHQRPEGLQLIFWNTMLPHYCGMTLRNLEIVFQEHIKYIILVEGRCHDR